MGQFRKNNEWFVTKGHQERFSLLQTKKGNLRRATNEDRIESIEHEKKILGLEMSILELDALIIDSTNPENEISYLFEQYNRVYNEFLDIAQSYANHHKTILKRKKIDKEYEIALAIDRFYKANNYIGELFHKMTEKNEKS